jgi:hypothetical protein
MTSAEMSGGGRVVDRFDVADGRVMTVLVTGAGDAERICALYRGLTFDDRRRRFFGAFRPDLEWCEDWATVGERGGHGIVAVVTGAVDADAVPSGPVDGEEIAGEAGYAMREDGDGDFAITVADDWRGWLGPYLLDVLIRHAADAGVANLQAEVLLENAPMLSLLRRRDPVSLGHDDGMVRLSVGTVGTVASWPPADDRPKVLVEVAGRRWSGEQAAEDAGLVTAMCSGPAARTRHECPVLRGEPCPLAQDADAIVVLLDPADERTERLVEGHRRMAPGVPVLVRRPTGTDHDAHLDDDMCVDVDPTGAGAVAQVLALIGAARPQPAK